MGSPLTLQLKLHKAPFIFTSGSAMDGQFFFHIPKISHPCAPLNWVIWLNLTLSLKNEM